MSAALATARVTSALTTAVRAIPGVRTTASSTSVSTPSRTNTTTYCPRCAAPRAAWTPCAPARSAMATSGHEVDEREDEDPDEVDEAPVEPEELDPVCAR